MQFRPPTCCAATLVLLPVCAALGQSRFVIADRNQDALFAIWDRNGNGQIDEPDEVTPFFNAANGSGTPTVLNPTAMATRPDGLIVLGDQLLRAVYLFEDLNRDGDVQDVGESRIVADVANASGISFAFPTGASFDPAGILFVVNAGNAFGNDGIYRLEDLNGDGDFQDPGEITVWVGEGAFGPGNGPFSPQEIVFLPAGVPAVGFLRNSSAGLHGVYRFVDLNGNGRADDPGEFTIYFDLTNSSGIAPAAGFALELDSARPGSLYTIQIAAGGVDQLIRLTDLNGDGDAQDPGEAVIVFSTAESGFSAIDILSLSDGRVLLTDNSGKRVIVLTDLDSDGLFASPGERADYFANTLLAVGDIRQIASLPVVCQANCDLSTTPPVLNVADFSCFLSAFAAGSLYANCDSSTAEPVLNVADFSCFLQRFAAGCE
jgi:hypothetical protein